MSKPKTTAPAPPEDNAELLIESVVLCDQVRREDNLKLLFLGVYSDEIKVSKLPFMMNMAAVIAVRVMQPGSFHFRVTVTDPLGQKTLESLEGDGRYEGEPGRIAWLPIPLPPFMMGVEGPYVLGVEVGDAARNERFHVIRLAPAVQVTSAAPN